MVRGITLYIQTLHLQHNLSQEYHHLICHHAKYYIIVDDILYTLGVDSILRQCLTHEEVEHILNDCHLGECGGHLSRMDIAQK